MATVSPDSSGTSYSARGSTQPGRLPLRWALIVLVTAAAGIACFTADGVAAAVVGASAVAAALHSMLA
jgi:hypothetical protein